MESVVTELPKAAVVSEFSVRESAVTAPVRVAVVPLVMFRASVTWVAPVKVESVTLVRVKSSAIAVFPVTVRLFRSVAEKLPAVVLNVSLRVIASWFSMLIAEALVAPMKS